MEVNMRTALLGLGFLGAGLVGALAAQILFPPPEPTVDRPGDPAHLASRVADLEKNVDLLAGQVRLLETRPPTVLEAAPAPGDDGVGPSEPGEAAPAVAGGELEEKILDVVERREEEERRARDERRAAMAAEWEAAMLTRLQEELSLDAYQKEELARILAERRERMTALRDRYFSGEGRGGPEQAGLFREEMQKVREETTAKIQELLTPEQFEAFQSQDRGGRGGFGGPGGGRGRR
jgi:hypothetical protein